ncbi:MAG: radical SAM/SPASM domain-containing protein [Candidatus Competibacteraceae bacterium]|nr:radical SAM/SPASM domain-containing protein [Candidatus Competibacteraceae bacterium]
MESIYYAITWACHRRCKHCYEDRFRPYIRSQLEAVVKEAETCFPAIVEHLPPRMRYLDLEDIDADGKPQEKPSRIILSGGEVLIDPVRERILYPLLERLRDKYRSQGGVKIVVQTTGDLLTESIIDELLARDIWMISVAGMDDYHVGMQGDKKFSLQDQLTGWFEQAGMSLSQLASGNRKWLDETGPLFSFFGATPDAWIGKLWPRGRAWENGLSTATLQDNFCNAWSGGLNFLRHGYSGSEVSIEPNGNIYPCCMKTKRPIGSLAEEPLIDILDSLQGHPVFEAIATGHPERMGITYGWDVAQFIEQSRTTTPQGKPYQNLCIGCDRFHEQVLEPVIESLRQQRLARRRSAA